MKNDIVRFSSEYTLDKKTFFEASMHEMKLNLLFDFFASILLFTLAFFTKEIWIACAGFIPIVFGTFLIFARHSKVKKDYETAMQACKNKSFAVCAKLLNSKIVYTTKVGKKTELHEEYKYVDIKNLWKSKNLFIFNIQTSNGNRRIALKKEDVDNKKLTNFIKEKRKHK